MRMNPVIAEWVDALRSGDYCQGLGDLAKVRYNLIANNRILEHCATGVLCDLAANHGIIDKEKDSAKYDTVELIWYDNEIEHASNIVSNWAGLSQAEIRDIETWNDGSEGHPSWSFNEIADEIELLCEANEQTELESVV